MDGHFYMYNDAAVQSVPFNVDALLSGSLKLGADVLAGGKQIRTYFIDYVSGKVSSKILALFVSDYEHSLFSCIKAVAPRAANNTATLRRIRLSEN